MEGTNTARYTGSRAEWILQRANDFDLKSREMSCGGCGAKKANWVCLDPACVTYNRGGALLLCDSCDGQFHPPSSPVMVGHRRLATVLYISLQMLYRNHQTTTQSFPLDRPQSAANTARAPYPASDGQNHSYSTPTSTLPSPPVSPAKISLGKVRPFDHIKKEIVEEPSEDMEVAQWAPPSQQTVHAAVVNQDRSSVGEVLPRTRLFPTVGAGHWAQPPPLLQPPAPADLRGPDGSERPVEPTAAGGENPAQDGGRVIEYRATFGNNLRPIHTRYACILGALRQDEGLTLSEAFRREAFSKLSVKNCLGIAELRLVNEPLYQKVFDSYKDLSGTHRITVAGLEQECRRALSAYRSHVKDMRDRGELLPFFDVTY